MNHESEDRSGVHWIQAPDARPRVNATDSRPFITSLILTFVCQIVTIATLNLNPIQLLTLVVHIIIV